MWRYGTKCKYMFMLSLKNLARKGLTHVDLATHMWHWTEPSLDQVMNGCLFSHYLNQWLLSVNWTHVSVKTEWKIQTYCRDKTLGWSLSVPSEIATNGGRTGVVMKSLTFGDITLMVITVDLSELVSLSLHWFKLGSLRFHGSLCAD